MPVSNLFCIGQAVALQSLISLDDERGPIKFQTKFYDLILGFSLIFLAGHHILSKGLLIFVQSFVFGFVLLLRRFQVMQAQT